MLFASDSLASNGTMPLGFPQSLSEKYRPQRIADFIGLDKPKRIAARLASAPFSSAWGFIGPSGTGKTTLALALANEIPAELHHIPSQDCNLENITRARRICQYVPSAGWIWCLARVPGGDFTIKGTDDAHETYMLFVTSHDGSTSAQARLTDVRVVCQNTLNMALSSGASGVRVKHTRDAERKLDHAKRLMTGAVQDARTLQEKLDLLAIRRMTKDSMLDILDRVFPKPEADTGAGRTRRDNILADVLRLYESNDANAFPQVRGTAYNLLNAITEFTDHERSARVTDGRASAGYDVSQARAENALFGTGERIKSQALEVILEGTKDAPSQSRTIYTAPAAPAFPSVSGILGDILAKHESGDLFN